MRVDFTQVRRLCGYHSFLAFIAGAAISLGAANAWMSLEVLPAWLAALIGVLTIVFGVVSLPWLLRTLRGPLLDRRARRDEECRIEDELQSLTAEEALIFWSMIADGRRHVFAKVQPNGLEPAMQALVNRRVLEPQTPVGDGWTLKMSKTVAAMFGNEVEFAKATVERVTAHLNKTE